MSLLMGRRGDTTSSQGFLYMPVCTPTLGGTWDARSLCCSHFGKSPLPLRTWESFVVWPESCFTDLMTGDTVGHVTEQALL